MRTQREHVIREVTNDLLKSRFTTELGQKARVERSVLRGDHMEPLREVLADIGRDIASKDPGLKGMEYRGSLSIHVFTSEALKCAAFMTLTNLGSMTFDLADGALRELTGSTMEAYGKVRQKLRSGF